MERNSGETIPAGRNLRVEPFPLRRGYRLFTLKCPHGTTEALTNNADDGEVLAFVVSYDESAEGCGCADGILSRLRLTIDDGQREAASPWL
jgi:hypothetical protein